MKNPDKFTYKIKFYKKQYKTIAVSDIEAISHIAYIIMKEYSCTFEHAKSKLEIVGKSFHSKGEYKNRKKDFNKINELYSELYLEQAKEYENQIKEIL
jgi:hypothetical protein